MLSDEKIEKCNSFLVSLFIFCFLNIIIRAFFRDINCTLTFPIARPTHFFRKEKKNSRFTGQRSKYFALQAHDLILRTIGMM